MIEEKENRALGNQNSGGEWRCEDCGAKADEWFDCCKNPARAEAQDEGVVLSASDRACYEYPGKDQSDLRAAFVAGACFIAAHPSPTPAADADRVRIAVEALEATKNRVREWPIDDQETCMCGSPVSGHGMGDGHSPVSQGDHAISMIVEAIDEALAALKSTAAKEGGE